ncbi:MAG: RHS repeat domain-containing protein, partial [Bacteroidota bacterium]
QSWSQAVDIMEGETSYSSSSVFRKHKTYENRHPRNSRSGIRQFNDDGTFNVAIADGFIPSFEVRDDGYANPSLGWEEQSEITLYDVHSHALEVKDINENYASTKYDKNNARVLSTAANARYKDYVYSGFENEDFYQGRGLIEGGIYLDNGFINDRDYRSHTGRKSIGIDETGGTVFRYTVDREAGSPNRYTASVWQRQNDGGDTGYFTVSGGGANIISSKLIGNSGVWELWEAQIYISHPSDDFTIFCKTDPMSDNDVRTYFDDFRIRPVDATMTSYVYNEWGELSDILDANNLFTHYEYDAMGRLQSVTRETLSDGPIKVSETIIHYANDN